MYTITGKYASALITLDHVEDSVTAQVIALLNCEVFHGQRIAIMPDTHAGVGCVIGFTSTIDFRDPKIIPNVIGVDIGCGVVSVDIGDILPVPIDVINKRILQVIPMGFAVNTHKPHLGNPAYEKLCRKVGVDYGRVCSAVGSLGGGNHFIEIGKSANTGHYWLTIHSGSRNFGLQICKYHQNKAVQYIEQNKRLPIAELKQKYSGLALGEKIAAFNASAPKTPQELCYLEGSSAEEYLEDMALAQQYAIRNREAIWQRIAMECGFRVNDQIASVHNYINFDDGIIRKGAVRAHRDERLIIPFNMRDGLLLCVGKGNPEWNHSAPHGAGRVMSRAEAKRTVTMPEYEKAMAGVYSTCINTDTLDESPMAYKSAELITNAIQETCTVTDTVRPVLNIKAGDQK